MSQGTPNLRVGLEVQIFGQTQMRRAQAALSQLGMTIEDVSDSLVNVNGVQTRYYRGLVRVTGATKQSRDAQEQAATAAIQNATANARTAAQISKTASAAAQATAQLAGLQRQQAAAARATQQLAQHQARTNITIAGRVIAQNNAAHNQQQTANLRHNHVIAVQNNALNNRIIQGNQALTNALALSAARQVNNQANQNHQAQMLNQRHLNNIAMQNLRHQNAMQRLQFGGGGGGFGVGIMGGVGRVIAYDMLRRTITNIYQGVWGVAEALQQWTVESVQFNDELARAQTVFTGLGLIGTRNEQGGPMSIPEAEISTDPKVQEVLRKAQEGSDKMMRGLIKITALTGSDMDEVVSSARQLLPDLINKRSKAGLPNPYLQNPDELNMITQQMVKLASVLKMSDPGGRPLKWHMTALQELFSGTSGGGKDKGREAVRSLRAREGIKMTDEEAESLAKTVNSGDLVKASNLIESVLERSGQGIVNLSNLMAKTLKPNVDGTITALRLFGRDFTEILHEDLIADFTAIRVSLFELFEDPRYKVAMGELGKEFNNVFGDLRGTVFGFLQKIIDDPSTLVTTLTPVLTNLKEGLKAVRIAFEALGLYLSGLFGTDLGVAGLATSLEAVRDNSYEAGVNMGTFVSNINFLLSDLNLVIDVISLIGQGIALLSTYAITGFTLIIEFMANLYARYLSLVPDMFVPSALRQWSNERLSRSAQDSYATTFGMAQRAADQYERFMNTAYRTAGINNNQPAGTPPIATPGVVSPANPYGAMIPNAAVMTAGQPGGLLGRQTQIAPAPGSQPINFAAQNPNLQVSDNAIVEGFRVARPMRFEPRRVDQSVSIKIDNLTVTASDTQSLSDQLVAISRRSGGITPAAIGGIPVDAAAQRGFID
jgi:hypothetical protein